MTPQEFVAKWRRAHLSERSACQQHFLDLCDLLGQEKPAAADPDGAWYTFERGVTKTTGGDGWADVWMRGHFGWEYKGKHKDLAEAYQQLLLYREDLENPPLLVVCDMDRFEVHTNFTGTAKRVHAFNLDGLAEPANLEVLRKLFSEPDSLRPGQTAESITRQAAERFGQLADALRVRKIEAPDAAHFLMKLMFCMFAEDIGLLPPKLFSNILNRTKDDPKRLTDLLKNLFRAMAQGGDFGADPILFFNGGLFDDAAVIELKPEEIRELIQINEHDWGSVEPSIFGTLFERTLDPAKRSQIGAHYTSRQDILTLLEPVVMVPLRREWAEVKAKCEKLWEKVKSSVKSTGRPAARGGVKPSKPRKDHDRALQDFLERLAHVTILDPACGSGNFLYVAINLLLDLEKEIITYAAAHGMSLLPQVRPTQLAGIEINPYAQQLAQVVIWIGYLQWMHDNGFNPPRDPVLEPIESIHLMDAILDLSDPRNPREPMWPKAHFFVGNPPFLGGSRMLEVLGHDYQQAMKAVYDERISGTSDLCCFWFDKSRRQLISRHVKRVGLLATQSIRGGVNRECLDRIKTDGDIFFAISDRNWVLDGALVHVSLIGFDDGGEQERFLDPSPVARINADLTTSVDVTVARSLAENLNIAFIGPKKAGRFNVAMETAVEWLKQPNPHGRPNSDVLVPWINGTSLLNRKTPQWIISVDPSMGEADFAPYQLPYEHVLANVKPERDHNKEARTRRNWWLFKRTAPELRETTQKFHRYLGVVRHTKHRIFVWIDPSIIIDDGIFGFARDDDYFFGLLHSKVHEVWALAKGTQVRDRESGFRYTPTTCFETFPFPGPTEAQRVAIAEAAKELDTLRSNWLNPPEWTREEILEFPGSVDGPWARYVASPNASGIGTVRYPRVVPRDAQCAQELAKRTLTNLYNERPTWLDLAHRRLDEAVFAAYGWKSDISDDELLAKLLALNLERAAASVLPKVD